MASRVVVPHKASRLKSLQTFYSLLPEFSEAPKTVVSLADKAFDKSIIQGVTDVRAWKPIRDEALALNPRLTPRELARFKFSVSYTSPLLLNTCLGRPALHQWLDTKAKEMLPHMNSLELVSVLLGYGSNVTLDFYEEIMNSLYKEILQENDLNTLAMSLYAVCNSYNPTVVSIPATKDPKHSLLCSRFVSIVSPKLIDRITEFSDDQFATICAGIGGNGVNFEDIPVAYPLVDAIETEVINRRGKRMAIENLVDVASGFFNSNLGSEDLAKLLTGKIMEKKKELNYFTGVDYALSLSQREVCNKDLLFTVNTLIKNNIETQDFLKITKYIINTECKDEDLIKKLITCINSYKFFHKSHYYDLKKLQYYLNKHLSHLVPQEFVDKVEFCGYEFIATKFLDNNLEVNTSYYKEFNNWMLYLNQSCLGPYVYSNHDWFHWAWMPQKVAIMLAMPKFHLVGKWEEDHRIIKEPKRKFKISNGFETRCKWLEMLGFKVIRINYQDLAENAVSKAQRDSNMTEFLKQLGITPLEATDTQLK